MKLTPRKKDPDQIYNITVKQLFSLSNIEPYKALNYIQDSNQIGEYKGKMLADCTFEQVMDMRSCQKMTIDKVASFFKWVYGIPKKQFLKLRVLDFYKGLNYITKQSQELYASSRQSARESKINESLWKRAGGGKLSVFGNYNTPLHLAFELKKYPGDVIKRTYGEVVTMAKYNSIYKDVCFRYHILNTPKN